ncbi:MAG: hypothetical protein WAK45_01440 [Methanoregula sp.]|uniref:Kelch repeat-containing protein n=1 Tax=Methanoregula sp. TaxID=2052170 RepID=UPI003BAEC6C3
MPSLKLIKNNDRIKRKCMSLFCGCLFVVLLGAFVPVASAAGTPSLAWTEATAHTPFSARIAQSAVTFNNALWVMGGENPDSTVYYSDVWSSPDGTTWKQVTADAQFGKRYGQGSVVFDNKIWVIGGRDAKTRNPLNDVWYSSDGITWTEATANAPFAGRWDFGIAVYNGNIWVVGGTQDGITHNDVWYSPDGVTWTEATAAAAFSPRMNPETVAFNNTLWLTGGFDWRNDFNDVWETTDGVTWTPATPAAAFPERRYFGLVTAGNGMWLIGGLKDYMNSGDPYYDDVWYSPDGVTWTKVTDNATFAEANGYSTVFFDNRLWVIDGDQGNSVWYSKDLGTVSPGTGTTLSVVTNPAGSQVLVNKSVSPWSIKQGMDSNVTITLFNAGPEPVSDIEIADGTLPILPVVGGMTEGTIPGLLPHETYSLSYTLHASAPGMYALNETTVMYADAQGNYHVTVSNAPELIVLSPLIAPTPAEAPGEPVVTAGAIAVIVILAALYLIMEKKP